jgi:hypothetical protein
MTKSLIWTNKQLGVRLRLFCDMVYVYAIRGISSNGKRKRKLHLDGIASRHCHL